MTRFTKNFKVSELACHDGMPVPQEYYENAKAICENAQVLRDLLGTPLYVVSGYRTLSHNTKVGGVQNSYHLTASALDLKSHHWEPEQLATLYKGLIRMGLVSDGGVGYYPESGFIHVDIGRPRRWVG
jgi:uncharacterized protein YcbK (DUF882 family)